MWTSGRRRVAYSAPIRRKMNKWIRGYYLATPLFAAIDLLWNINVRAAGLQAYPVAKWLYYLFCTGCAGMILRFPAWSGATALAESAVNITVLVVGFLSAGWRMAGLI